MHLPQVIKQNVAPRTLELRIFAAAYRQEDTESMAADVSLERAVSVLEKLPYPSPYGII